MDFQSFALGVGFGGMAIAVAIWGEWRRIDVKMRRVDRKLERLDSELDALARAPSLHDRLIANAIQRGSKVL